MDNMTMHRSANAGNPDDDPLIRDLARALAALLRSAAPPANGPAFYTPTALPPGITSRRAFAARCRTIPAARREGRAWVVAVADWHAARTPAPRPADDAESLLAAAGVRLRRGAR